METKSASEVFVDQTICRSCQREILFIGTHFFERLIQGVFLRGRGSVKERVHVKNVGVDRMTILKWIFAVGWECVDWIDLPQDRNKLRAVVKTVMNLRVSQNAGNLWSVVGLCSLEWGEVR
jgi:hypothetical protein